MNKTGFLKQKVKYRTSESLISNSPFWKSGKLCYNFICDFFPKSHSEFQQKVIGAKNTTQNY